MLYFDTMQPFDVAGFLTDVWLVIGGIMRLDPAAFRTALRAAEGGQIALFVMFMAGMSDTLGQSVVLLANRVTRRRFVVSLLFSGLLLIVSVFFWVMTISLIASLVFETSRPFRDVLVVVALSHAPLLFGFLVLLPYLGNVIYHILRVWVFLAVVVGVAVVYPFGVWEAVACSVLGWLLLEVIVHLPFLHIDRLDRWLWRLSTGTASQFAAEEAVDFYLQQVDGSRPMGERE